LNLPADSWARIVHSLRVLETFPSGGRALQGKWAGTRMILGPWPWMLLIYRYDEGAGEVRVVAMHDARSAASALAAQNS
jgi:plasmid stabilization system protein ParE